MTEKNETVVVNVNITISSRVLITLVQQAKEIVGADAKGHYRVDTADLLARLTSQFLKEYDFEAYVANRRNYPSL